MQFGNIHINISRGAPARGVDASEGAKSEKPTVSSSRSTIPRHKHPSINLLQSLAVGVGVFTAVIAVPVLFVAAPVLGMALTAGALVAYAHSISENTDAGNPPKAEAGAGTPPKAETGAGMPPKAETGAGMPPKAEAGAGTPPKAEAGAGTPPKTETGAGATEAEQERERDRMEAEAMRATTIANDIKILNDSFENAKGINI